MSHVFWILLRRAPSPLTHVCGQCSVSTCSLLLRLYLFLHWVQNYGPSANTDPCLLWDILTWPLGSYVAPLANFRRDPWCMYFIAHQRFGAIPTFNQEAGLIVASRSSYVALGKSSMPAAAPIRADVSTSAVHQATRLLLHPRQ